MIEKKIRYNINIEKPSKTKPVTQGGVLNYLGKQKTVTAPRRWRSSADHPIAHLAYITKDEEKILIDLNLYGSLKGKPNKGPSGIMSLQGSGGGAGGGDGGGAGGGDGDSGPGGSDDGTGHGGPGPGSPEGSSLGDANDQGGTAAPGGPAGGPAGGPGGSEGFDSMSGPTGFGEQDETGFGTDYSDETMGPVGPNAMAGVDMSMPALQTLDEKAMAFAMSQVTPASLAGRALGMSIAGPIGGFIGGMIGSNIGRGVTGPSDDTQEQSSVQSGPAQSPVGDGGGGITNLVPTYAPLVNESTGSNTADALLAMYRANLRRT